nr:MAG TPA: ethanolamine utilization protein [Caudoviricetes sp.]
MTTTTQTYVAADAVLLVLCSRRSAMQSHTIATYVGVSTEEARRALADLEEAGAVRRVGDDRWSDLWAAVEGTRSGIVLPPRPTPIKERLEEVVRILGEHGPLTITDAAALFDTTLEDAHHLLTLAWARHDADFDVDSGRWQATGRPWW